MKPKTIIPLVMGVVVGGVAIKIVVDVVGNAQAASVASMSKCVVAKVDIDFAEELTADKLTLKEWPKDKLPANSFSSLEQLKSRVSQVFVPKDVPIYSTMLAPAGTPPGIQTFIEDGYRAVSVPIDEVSGVAYQIKQGDHVDVVALVKHKKGRNLGHEMVSRIILQNVKVAAIGRTINTPKGGSDKAKTVARSITLLLTPDEVTQLHLAQSLGGRLSLALRGSTDETESGDSVATADGLLGGERGFNRPKPKPAATPQSFVPDRRQLQDTWDVTVISGNDMQRVSYEEVDGNWHPSDSDNWQGSSTQPKSANPPAGDQGDYDFVIEENED